MFAWFNQFRSLEKRRQSALHKAPPGVMQDYLAEPFIASGTPITQVPIVSLDLETTGLNVKQHQILSLGAVSLEQEHIKLASTWYRVARLNQALPQESVVIHNITDDEMQQGHTMENILPELLQQLKGKVMLAHYRRVEQQFLNAACQRLYGVPFLVPTIDTIELGLRSLQRKNHTIQTNDLRLFNLRKHYNLPQYKAHNALIDAIATAELFLALRWDISPKGQAPLRDFLTR
jgi:DNA polymerase-3 subunit epsilon